MAETVTPDKRMKKNEVTKNRERAKETKRGYNEEHKGGKGLKRGSRKKKTKRRNQGKIDGSKER